MHPIQLDLNKENIKNKISEKETVYFNSRFNFLNQHNGIRPNKLHLLMAPTHVGKSTLTHAIINSLVEDNKDIRILLILTEETRQDYESAISNFVKDYDSYNNSIRVLVEDKESSDEEIKRCIRDSINYFEIDIVVIDNITTSKLYMDKTTDAQSKISLWLKSLLNKTTVFAIAHTNGSNYNNELLDENHIRGSKTITNIAEFLYVMQPVRMNNNLYQYLRILKHRGQSPTDKFYKLEYNNTLRTITNDKPVSFDDFKELFKLRNKL